MVTVNEEETVRRVVKAFNENELLKIGNRSYLNAFKYPESRFDVKDLMPNPGMLQVLTDPGKLFTDKYVIPPSSLVFRWAGLTYEKKWWGQIAGGLVDARTVMQAAINALTSGRTWKEQVVLRGDFPMSGALELPSYTSLETLGRLYLQDGVNTNVIENADPTGGNARMQIVGGLIDGNKANNPTGGHGIAFTKVADSVIDRIRTEYCKGSGVSLENTSDECAVTKLYSMFNDGYGLTIAETNDLTVAHCQFRQNQQNGLMQSGGDFNTFLGNHYLSNVVRGAFFYASQQNMVIGDHFRNNNQHGCLLQSVTCSTFMGCTFDLNSRAATNTYDGLNFYSGCLRNEIMGSIARDWRDPHLQRYGIREEAGVGNDKNDVHGVVALDNVTGQISLTGANSHKYNCIED